MEIFAYARKIKAKYEDFRAIHIRSGDVIYDKYSKARYNQPSIYKRVLVNEVAVVTIKEQLQKGYKIICFSYGLKMCDTLKKEAKKSFINGEDLYIVSDFVEKLPKEFQSGIYRALFEIYLMSLANTLCYSQESGFSSLVTMIGEVSGISFYEFCSKDKQYQMLMETTNKIIRNFL